MLQELWISAPAIEQDRVIMIAYRTRQHQLDLISLCGLDQAARERIVGLRAGPQQELPLPYTEPLSVTGAVGFTIHWGRTNGVRNDR
ncbi:MAG TPA: hypothetical protein VFK02_18250 [Kofleriaceae bacterium]|nr:hypothetical protein [Kofleriaceae bacterium]